jgi:hypothetical protein
VRTSEEPEEAALIRGSRDEKVKLTRTICMEKSEKKRGRPQKLNAIRRDHNL